MAKRKKVDKNRQIVFVLSISARGFDLVRYDNLLHPPKITVAQQAENPKLGHFINTMRTQRNSGKLSADRVAKLEAVGFAWAASGKIEHQVDEKGKQVS